MRSPRTRPAPSPELLFQRRLAWRALSMVLDQYQLAGVTLKLNPDDPTQAFPGATAGEIGFYSDFLGGRGQVLATVLLEGTRARVLVERIERLVRPRRLREFRAAEVGIAHRRGAPDIDADVDLTEVLEAEGELMRTARPRVPPRHRRPGGRPPTRHAIGGDW